MVIVCPDVSLSERVTVIFMVLTSVHYLFKFVNIPADALQYSMKFLQLKHKTFDMFGPFPVGHPQGMYISVCIKHSL